jgi:hypothetical protein
VGVHDHEALPVATPGAKIAPKTGIGRGGFKREFGARPELVEPVIDLLLAFHMRAVRAARKHARTQSGSAFHRVEVIE